MSITHTITKGTSSSTGSGALSGSYYQVGSNNQDIDTVLSAGSVNVAVAASFGPSGSSSGDLLSIELIATANMTVTTNLSGTGTADVQTISISGTPTGGSFPLVYSGQVAAGIPYNASAATVQAALQALSSIGAGNLTCTGGPLPGTPIVCTFAGSLATGYKAPLLTGSGGLTGGSSPTVSVAHTTPGTPQDTISLVAGVPLAWDAASGLPCPFVGAVTGFFVTSTNAGRLQGRILTY